jgi:hypothetical protein
MQYYEDQSFSKKNTFTILPVNFLSFLAAFDIN